jgi:hypothetical protein
VLQQPKIRPIRLSYSAKSAAIQRYFSLTINQQTVLSATTIQRNEQAGRRTDRPPSFQVILAMEKLNKRSTVQVFTFAEWQSYEDGEDSQRDEQHLGPHACFSSQEPVSTAAWIGFPS